MTRIGIPAPTEKPGGHLPKPAQFLTALQTLIPRPTGECDSSHASSEKLLLQRTETVKDGDIMDGDITESQNWSKCREQMTAGCPVPADLPTTQPHS